MIFFNSLNESEMNTKTESGMSWAVFNSHPLLPQDNKNVTFESPF